MKQYNVPEFDNLKTSTCTVMVYSNMLFNLNNIFINIPIYPIETPLTKKKKNIDKKQIVVPYGKVISLRNGLNYRGVDLKKNEKYWCVANCRLTKKKGNQDVKVLTVIECPHKYADSDINTITFYCTNCNKYYSLKDIKNIPTFLNQVTIVLSIGTINLNIMLFKDNFKIAGCKNYEDAITATKLIWNYISKIKDSFTFKDDYKNAYFEFRLVMRNVDFKLGFIIDRIKLNNIMNTKKYENKIHICQCESTGHTNVNIKILSEKPPNFEFDTLTYPTGSDEPVLAKTKETLFSKNKKKNEYVTFIIFSSSEIILSGKYYKSMKSLYEFFIPEIVKNKHLIEEKLEKDLSPQDFLKSF